MEATGVATVQARPQQVLEWILDLDRYRQADTKIGRVIAPADLDAEGRGRVRYRGRLRGVPTPVDTQDVHLERWHRLTLSGAPRVWTRLLVDFEGTFECEATDGGTRVTHREVFRFKPRPVGWIVDRVLGRWLADQMSGEMARLKELVEQAARAADAVTPVTAPVGQVGR